jgi:hypothetical protein
MSQIQKNGEEGEVIGDTIILHRKLFGFQQANPILVFEHIFAYLSPGYLWLFGRLVCKSWKEIIEQYIVRSVYSKGLIQIIMSAYIQYDSWHEDAKYRIHNTIYRCSGYNNGIFSFTPFKKWPPYSISGPIQKPGESFTRDPNWKLLDVISSLFPAPFRKEEHLIEYYKNLEARNFDYFIFYSSPRYCHPNIISQSYIDEFHAKGRQSTPTSQVSSMRWFQQNWCSNTHFERPEVYMDLKFGKYLLKCRFLTKLSLLGNIQGKNWHQQWTLVIDKVEINFSSLLSWRCTCPLDSRHLRPPCSVDILLSRNIPCRTDRGQTLIPACMYSFNHHSYSKTFSYYPCSDKDSWQAKVESLGEPAVYAFLPPKFNVLKKRKSQPLNLPCQSCLARAGNRVGTRDRINSVHYNWGSNKCITTSCRRCCTSDECLKHRNRN